MSCYFCFYFCFWFCVWSCFCGLGWFGLVCRAGWLGVCVCVVWCVVRGGGKGTGSLGKERWGGGDWDGYGEGRKEEEDRSM